MTTATVRTAEACAKAYAAAKEAEAAVVSDAEAAAAGLAGSRRPPLFRPSPNEQPPRRNPILSAARPLAPCIVEPKDVSEDGKERSR